MKNIDTGECLVMDTKENLNATIDLLEKLTRYLTKIKLLLSTYLVPLTLFLTL